jgi:uncharacterized damage-inducible protein DinB
MKNTTGNKQRRIEPVESRVVEIGTLLGMMEEARGRTLAVISNLTPTQLDGPPPCGKNTIAALLYHTAAIEVSWLYDVLGTPFPPELDSLFSVDVRDEYGNLNRLEGRPLQEYLDRLSRVRSILLRSYASMSLEEFRRPREVEGSEVTPEWVLQHLMQHEAEHRGQISPDG